MQNPLPHPLLHQTFWVTPERGLYWEEENTLIVADLHLGKTGHFRKSGIAVPQGVYKADLQRLIALLYAYKAERLLIVGDFTHSEFNRELDLFKKWRNDFSSLQIDLVRGNHDILEDEWYRELDITVHEWEWKTGRFLFLHEDKKHLPEEKKGVDYTFSGHVHPGILLRGPGRQSLKFPCYYFGKKSGILPAFSRFSGMHLLKPEKGDTVYAVTEKEVLEVG